MELGSQGTVVLEVSVRFINRTLAWMRKVVGSNPDNDLYRIASFSFADTMIGRRLLRDRTGMFRDCSKRQAMR